MFREQAPTKVAIKNFVNKLMGTACVKGEDCLDRQTGDNTRYCTKKYKKRLRFTVNDY